LDPIPLDLRGSRGLGKLVNMEPSDETIIKLSKKKIGLILLGASAFIAAGIWMLSLDDASIQSQRRMSSPMYLRGLAIVAIVFFGIFWLVALKKLFETKPGLIFNNAGIVDNASSVSAGFIPWSDVLGAKTFEMQNQKMLIIQVREPEEYIARGSSLKQTLNKANYKMVGSPISISSNTLAIDFSELSALFDRYQGKYGVADMDQPLFGQDVRSPEIPGYNIGHGDRSLEANVKPESKLLNWSPLAVRGTVGAGGIGILVLLLSSLDLVFGIQIPFWIGFTLSLLPMFIFFLAVPDFLPRSVVRPAQWFAVVWYLVFAVLSISLALFRGLEGVDVLLIGFILLGALPCVVAIRKLRAPIET
jgi:hypothetical protein